MAVGQHQQDQAAGRHQTADEAAARQVVATPQQQQRGRHHQPGQRAQALAQQRRGEGVFAAVLVADALATAEQTGGGQGGKGDHEDLAQGVEGAEVHQNHVDHVVPVPARQAVGLVPPGDLARQRQADRQQQGAGHAEAEEDGHAGMQAALPGGACAARRHGGHLAKHQGEEDQAEGFHHQLGHGHVRRVDRDEDHRQAQAAGAERGQQGQAPGQEGRRHAAGQGHQATGRAQQGDGAVAALQQLRQRRQQADGQQPADRQGQQHQVLAQRTVLKACRQQPGEKEHALEQAIPEQVATDVPGSVGAIQHLPDAIAQQVEKHPQRDRYQARHQRRGNAAPEVQIDVHRAARHGLHGRIDQPGLRPGVPGAEKEAADGQQHGAQPHRQANLVRRARVVATPAEEGLQEYQAGGGEQQGVGEDHHQGHRPADMPHLDQAAVLELLGDEAEERRQAGVGERCQGHGGAGQRHETDQTAQARQLAGAGGVVDGADGHEQRTFIKGVRHQIEDEGLQAIAGVGADQHGQLAQHGHRGVGQQALEVGLAEGEEGAQYRGGGAEGDQQGAPADGAAEHWIESGKQVDAGLDHGCRVQIGRHRGRCVHGIGQPQVEGHLRRLGEAAQQHQQHDGRQQRVAFDLLGAEAGELPVAGGAAEQDQPGQQRQAATAGDQQGL